MPVHKILLFTGIVSSSGELWKEHRSFSLSTLRNFGVGKRSLETQITQEIELFLSDISDMNGQPTDIQESLNVSISNIICSITFGKHYDHDDVKLHRLLKCVNENLTAPKGLQLFYFQSQSIPKEICEIQQKSVQFRKNMAAVPRYTYIRHVSLRWLVPLVLNAYIFS